MYTVDTSSEAVADSNANTTYLDIEALFRAHYGRVARIIARVVRDRARSEELAVEVFQFYCSNFMCRKAQNAARRAKDMGYGNVYVMSAGIGGWVGTSLPTESGEKRDT